MGDDKGDAEDRPKDIANTEDESNVDIGDSLSLQANVRPHFEADLWFDNQWALPLDVLELFASDDPGGLISDVTQYDLAWDASDTNTGIILDKPRRPLNICAEEEGIILGHDKAALEWYGNDTLTIMLKSVLQGVEEFGRDPSFNNWVKLKFTCGEVDRYLKSRDESGSGEASDNLH